MKSLVTALTIGALTNTPAMADTHTNAIEQVISRYELALNASDTANVMALYSHNPTFMPQHAPAQIGRDAVKMAYDTVFQTIKLNVEFTIHDVEVHGDTAWARTSSAGKTKILANDLTVNEGNNELFVFKREDGQWKIYQYLFATNQPRQ